MCYMYLQGSGMSGRDQGMGNSNIGSQAMVMYLILCPIL